MNHKNYNEEELERIETLLSSAEADVLAGLDRIGPGLLPQRLSIALYNVVRFYDDASVVNAAYDVLTEQAEEPLRSLVQQYRLLRQPDDGGDETTRKTVYAYIEQEAKFDSKLYVNSIIRVMHFFCQRALNSLKEMMQEMGMDPNSILENDPFESNQDLNWDDLDLDFDLEPFTITNDTGYLNDSNRDEQYSALDFVTQNIQHLQIYPSSVLMDISIKSEELAGIKKLTLIEDDRPLMLPSDLDQAPHLETLALHHIEDITPQAWNILQQAIAIEQFELELVDDATHPPDALFELRQITSLELSGAAMQLDFPIVLLGNLRHLRIGASTLEGCEQLFRQLNTLHHLETIELHPALETAYQDYQQGRRA